MTDILLYPDPKLTTVCEPITEFDSSVDELSKLLIKTVAAAGGLGLSAPQLGILKRMFVSKVGETDIMTFVNPSIKRELGEELIVQEGCLSLPSVNGKVKRNSRIHINAQDVFGTEFQVTLIDQDAVAFQHELDHLDGVTLFEKMGRIQRLTKKNPYMKRLRRWKKSQKTIQTK